MIETIFLTFLLLIVYCYFGYPFLIFLGSKYFHQKILKQNLSPPPSVSVVISAWNEEDVIRRKLENLLSFENSGSEYEILIGSDGSTDRTNEIIRGMADSRIKLVERKERRGKVATLNELLGRTSGEIIVFNDARQTMNPEAIRELIANFADPRVGCVSGELVFTEPDGITAKGVNLYWNYEKFMRRHEARVHSMLGATGAIYAIRKSLYRPVPENVVLDDMYTPLSVIKQGFRAVFDETAKAYDRPADSPKEEHRRKARTLYGNFQIFGLFPSLFIPGYSPIAIQLFSHKFLRLVVPWLMAAVFVLNFFLLRLPFYRIFLILQLIFYTAALTGWLLKDRREGRLKIIAKLCYIPYVFCLLNFSAVTGLWRFLLGKQKITWQKARGEK